jgi:hypothetical protein
MRELATLLSVSVIVAGEVLVTGKGTPYADGSVVVVE